MSFISIKFFIFLICVVGLYFIMPKKYRWIVLLCANLYFFVCSGIAGLVFLLFTAGSAWYASIFLEKINEKYKRLREESCTTREAKAENRKLCTKSKKKVMAVVMALNFGIWIILKYLVPGWLVPLGISYYTFIAMGYCIDIYRGKYAAEQNPLRFLLFLSFFPQMIQGPFSRYDVLGDALYEGHGFSFDRVGRGILRILWGLFKKLVIANKLALVTGTIYGDIETYSGVYIWIAAMLFALELYADFSGYIDIAAGAAQLFGIRLQENFRQPFFSRSIEEFWRRWHITLGAWFRDYVFYSVSVGKAVQDFGRKCKKIMNPRTARLIPSYIALVCVWTVTGLWHGANWTYILWGLLNMVVITVSMQLEEQYEKIKNFLRIDGNGKVWKLFQIARTFLLFSIMDMVSEVESVGKAFAMWRSMLTFEHWTYIKYPMRLFPAMEITDLAVVGIGLLLMFAVDIMKEKGKSIYAVLGRVPILVRYIGYAAVFYMILLFGEIGSGMSGGFMYAQF